VTLLVQFAQARALALDLPERPDATPTFTLLGPGGGTLLASTAVTLGTTNTTLSALAAAGATTVTVTSASGIIAGRTYLLAGHEDAGGERVTVKSIASTTVTLVRPLRLAKASAATFQSTRVECAITAAAAAPIARHNRLEITWAVSAVSQPTYREDVDIVRYVTEGTSATFNDVCRLDPIAAKRLPAGLWWPELRDECWAEIHERLAAKVDPGAVVSAGTLKRAHCWLIRTRLAEVGGPEWAADLALLAQRTQEALDLAASAGGIDANQDGTLEPHEQPRRGFVVSRG
jgi:hypothetical protein